MQRGSEIHSSRHQPRAAVVVAVAVRDPAVDLRRDVGPLTRRGQRRQILVVLKPVALVLQGHRRQRQRRVERSAPRGPDPDLLGIRATRHWIRPGRIGRAAVVGARNHVGRRPVVPEASRAVLQRDPGIDGSRGMRGGAVVTGPHALARKCQLALLALHEGHPLHRAIRRRTSVDVVVGVIEVARPQLPTARPRRAAGFVGPDLTRNAVRIRGGLPARVVRKFVGARSAAAVGLVDELARLLDDPDVDRVERTGVVADTRRASRQGSTVFPAHQICDGRHGGVRGRSSRDTPAHAGSTGRLIAAAAVLNRLRHADPGRRNAPRASVANCWMVCPFS